MPSLRELKEQRSKINAEIEYREGGAQETKGFDAATPVNTYGECGMLGGPERERNPERIIADLFTYHPPEDGVQVANYETLRDAAKHLGMVIWKNCPAGSDKTKAIELLRQAVMMANASIALRGRGL